jgi:hypothetical protein
VEIARQAESVQTWPNMAVNRCSDQFHESRPPLLIEPAG